MAGKYIYICDVCGEYSEINSLNKYELHTDHCSDVMHIVNGTKTLELCDKCAEVIIEMFKNEGEVDESNNITE